MSNKMWGGRFTERPDAIMEQINVSIDVDRHLYAQDIAASKAHAAMRAAQGIISANDAKNIAGGLDTILSEIDKGSFDFKRALEDIHMNVESRLGAVALAGTSFPIDRDATAKPRGFDQPMANSLDAVSDRDFVLETLSGAAIASVHLSRFAEEIVIWTSPLVGLVRLSDKFTTGSSIMPQKRNPDAAELVRAKTGTGICALTALLIVTKGRPLAYHKDMQDDKQGALEAFGALSLAIRAMTGMVADMVPDQARMKAAAGEGYATATDLADWLVRTLKMPFRDAHHGTGRIVAEASKQGVPLHQLPLKVLQAIEPQITAAAVRVHSVGAPVQCP